MEIRRELSRPITFCEWELKNYHSFDNNYLCRETTNEWWDVSKEKKAICVLSDKPGHPAAYECRYYIISGRPSLLRTSRIRVRNPETSKFIEYPIYVPLANDIHALMQTAKIHKTRGKVSDDYFTFYIAMEVFEK